MKLVDSQNIADVCYWRDVFHRAEIPHRDVERYVEVFRGQVDRNESLTFSMLRKMGMEDLEHMIRILKVRGFFGDSFDADPSRIDDHEKMRAEIDDLKFQLAKCHIRSQAQMEALINEKRRREELEWKLEDAPASVGAVSPQSSCGDLIQLGQSFERFEQKMHDVCGWNKG